MLLEKGLVRSISTRRTNIVETRIRRLRRKWIAASETPARSHTPARTPGYNSACPKLGWFRTSNFPASTAIYLALFTVSVLILGTWALYAVVHARIVAEINQDIDDGSAGRC